MLFLSTSLAQSDPISGGAGWVGAGLLGLVLCWLLLKHLPEKDKQINDFVNKKDMDLLLVAEQKEKRIDDQRKEFTAALTNLTAAFKQEAACERAACEKHFSTLADTMSTAFKTLGEQLSTHSQRNQQWLDLLKKQIEEAQKSGLITRT